MLYYTVTSLVTSVLSFVFAFGSSGSVFELLRDTLLYLLLLLGVVKFVGDTVDSSLALGI